MGNAGQGEAVNFRAAICMRKRWAQPAGQNCYLANLKFIYLFATEELRAWLKYVEDTARSKRQPSASNTFSFQRRLARWFKNKNTPSNIPLFNPVNPLLSRISTRNICLNTKVPLPLSFPLLRCTNATNKPVVSSRGPDKWWPINFINLLIQSFDHP